MVCKTKQFVIVSAFVKLDKIAIWSLMFGYGLSYPARALAGSLCCVLGQDTLLSQCLSPRRCRNTLWPIWQLLTRQNSGITMQQTSVRNCREPGWNFRTPIPFVCLHRYQQLYLETKLPSSTQVNRFDISAIFIQQRDHWALKLFVWSYLQIMSWSLGRLQRKWMNGRTLCVVSYINKIYYLLRMYITWSIWNQHCWCHVHWTWFRRTQFGLRSSPAR